jgi:hypothetical protein
MQIDREHIPSSCDLCLRVVPPQIYTRFEGFTHDSKEEETLLLLLAGYLDTLGSVNVPSQNFNR